MKAPIAIVVTLVNLALVLYFCYQSVTLIGEVGLAQWFGSLLPSIPFAITIYYVVKARSRRVWNWAFSLNAIVLLVSLAANVLEFSTGTAAFVNIWSATAILALFTLINTAFLLMSAARSSAGSITDTTATVGK